MKKQNLPKVCHKIKAYTKIEFGSRYSSSSLINNIALDYGKVSTLYRFHKDGVNLLF